MPGPLEGLRIVELAGIGPGPHCAMLLADLGADVIRVDRIGGVGTDLLNRGKRSIAVDLKHPDGVDMVLRLVERVDVLIEGFRPGVAERLGVGPAECLARNSRLVYGRITGWGREGPLASTAGHDIDYLALSGALGAIGLEDKPIPPLNLVADFGGGSLYLAVGILAAIFERNASGRGQLVDAAMVEGAAHLTTMHHGAMADGWWGPERRSNLLDGGAPFYDTYETADRRHMAVGALEPHFYAELLTLLGLSGEDLPDQMDRSGWPALRRHLAARFRSRTQGEWIEVFAGSDACVAPVLGLAEAPHHPQMKESFVEVDSVVQPAPTPRFGRTATRTPALPCQPGQHTDEILEELGIASHEVSKLRETGSVG